MKKKTWPEKEVINLIKINRVIQPDSVCSMVGIVQYELSHDFYEFFSCHSHGRSEILKKMLYDLANFIGNIDDAPKNNRYVEHP